MKLQENSAEADCRGDEQSRLSQMMQDEVAVIVRRSNGDTQIGKIMRVFDNGIAVTGCTDKDDPESIALKNRRYEDILDLKEEDVELLVEQQRVIEKIAESFILCAKRSDHTESVIQIARDAKKDPRYLFNITATLSLMIKREFGFLDKECLQGLGVEKLEYTSVADLISENIDFILKEIILNIS